MFFSPIVITKQETTVSKAMSLEDNLNTASQSRAFEIINTHRIIFSFHLEAHPFMAIAIVKIITKFHNAAKINTI